MDQERKAIFLEAQITVMAEEIEARQHVLFAGLSSGWTDRVRHAAQECAEAAESKEGHRHRSAADIKKEIVSKVKEKGQRAQKGTETWGNNVKPTKHIDTAQEFNAKRYFHNTDYTNHSVDR